MKKYICFLLFIVNIYANNVFIDNFIANTSTFKSEFVQTVTAGNNVKTLNGTMFIARPDKFRWDYDNKQVIISDGKTWYFYDPQLDQKIVKQNTALDDSPAAILAGKDMYSKYYVVEMKATQYRLKWFQLVSKNNKTDNGFHNIKLGFKEKKLLKMELVDGFGSTIEITFKNSFYNIKLSDDTFRLSK